jgi:hypothetical protein
VLSPIQIDVERRQNSGGKQGERRIEEGRRRDIKKTHKPQAWIVTDIRRK